MPAEIHTRASEENTVGQGFIQDFITGGKQEPEGSHTIIPVTYLLIYLLTCTWMLLCISIVHSKF